MEAEVVIQPGGGHKDVMARILDCMWVPLLEVKPGEYELIELNTKASTSIPIWTTTACGKACTMPWDVTMLPAVSARRIDDWPARYCGGMPLCVRRQT